MKIKALLSMMTGLSAFLAAAAPAFFVPELPSKPALNGKDSAVWNHANSTYGFFVRTTKQMELRRGRTLFGP